MAGLTDQSTIPPLRPLRLGGSLFALLPRPSAPSAVPFFLADRSINTHPIHSVKSPLSRERGFRGECRALGAPGERQAPAASLYSGAMMIATANCPVSAPAAGFGAAVFKQGDFRLSSGEALKKTNSVWVLLNFAPQGAPSGHSVPSPIVPAGKLNTTRTVLSSGDTPKKNEFCIDFVKFCPGHCSRSVGRHRQAPTRPHFIGLFGGTPVNLGLDPGRNFCMETLMPEICITMKITP